MNTDPRTARIDFHAHCLPGLDDGAADVDQSMAMLRDSARQGIDLVVGTPHFYMGQQSVAEFVNRRTDALHRLQAARRVATDCADLPPVLPGAEVLLCEGVSRLELRPLCFLGTNIILLELPFRKPPVWLAEEIESILFEQRLRVLLAHVDRYVAWYSAAAMAELLELPDVTAQVNADAVLDGYTWRKMRRRMPDPERLALGSDMHNTTSRPTRIGRAIRTLESGPFRGPWAEAVRRYEMDFMAELCC